jgi:ABC-2 type transport system permease protein
MFCLFVPALTMRVFSEENRIGSMETLVTLPVSSVEIVMGKYLASFISTLVLLVPTIFYVITVSILGNPDFGPIIGAYIGAFFLLASYSAIGVFASSVTKNQILSFFVAFIICAILTFLDWFKILLPAFLVKFLDFISASSHFESISRGIIDLRDIVYFLSLTALFIVLTVRSLQNSRRG